VATVNSSWELTVGSSSKEKLLALDLAQNLNEGWNYRTYQLYLVVVVLGFPNR
jgi:hypothetical protein